jgi:hypothetical protein
MNSHFNVTAGREKSKYSTVYTWILIVFIFPWSEIVVGAEEGVQ